MAVLCKCTKCGNQCEIDWKEGVKCPVCSSSAIYPIVKVDSNGTGLANMKHSSIETVLKKNKEKIIVYSLIAVIALSWLVLFLRMPSRKGVRSTQEQTAASMKGMQLYECSSCKYTFYAPMGDINVRCLRCGKERGQPLFKCRNCGTVFSTDEKGKIFCPSCESENVEGFYTK
ncbi:MAG: hypothetical protein PHO00_02400 [bacterium]|nr:hypothetical protein [bacterium]